MNLQRTIDLTRYHLDRHDLDNWGFRWLSNDYKILGQCWHGQQIIEVSDWFAALNQEWVVEQTILHEVAHALCPVWEGHNDTWKNVASKLGVMCLSGVNDIPINCPETYAHLTNEKLMV